MILYSSLFEKEEARLQGKFWGGDVFPSMMWSLSAFRPYYKHGYSELKSQNLKMGLHGGEQLDDDILTYEEKGLGVSLINVHAAITMPIWWGA